MFKLLVGFSIAFIAGGLLTWAVSRRIVPYIAGAITGILLMAITYFAYPPMSGAVALATYSMIMGLALINMQRHVSHIMLAGFIAAGTLVAVYLVPVVEGINWFHLVNLPDRFMYHWGMDIRLLIAHGLVFFVAASLVNGSDTPAVYTPDPIRPNLLATGLALAGSAAGAFALTRYAQFSLATAVSFAAIAGSVGAMLAWTVSSNRAAKVRNPATVGVTHPNSSGIQTWSIATAIISFLAAILVGAVFAAGVLATLMLAMDTFDTENWYFSAIVVTIALITTSFFMTAVWRAFSRPVYWGTILPSLGAFVAVTYILITR